MNVIAADDEHLALLSIENTIKKAIPGCTLNCFDNPGKAIDFARENKIEVAFLDIDMGSMNGLQLAKCLKDIYSKTNIVFTTGHSQYAVDAFAMHASGYLMKPVSVGAVSEAIDYLFHPLKPMPGKRVRVQTFGNFEVFVDEKPLSFSRSKTKELFAYLVMRRGARCNNNEIIATIWEDKQDSPALQNQYRHLVFDLKKALNSVKAEDVLVRQRGFLAVVPDNFSCDMYDFCDANTDSVNSYMGEFMAQYAWAEFTNAYLEKIR